MRVAVSSRSEMGCTVDKVSAGSMLQLLSRMGHLVRVPLSTEVGRHHGRTCLIEVLPGCVHDGLAGQAIAPCSPTLLRVSLQAVGHVPVNHPVQTFSVTCVVAGCLVHSQNLNACAWCYISRSPGPDVRNCSNALLIGRSAGSPAHICLVHALCSRPSLSTDWLQCRSAHCPGFLIRLNNVRNLNPYDMRPMQGLHDQ